MRYAHLFPIVVVLLVAGCGGSTGGSSEAPAIVWEPSYPSARLVAVDYYAPLGARGLLVESDNGDSLSIEACSADALTASTSLAACIDAVTLDGEPAAIGDLAEGKMALIQGTRIDWLGLNGPVTPGEAGRVTVDLQRAVVGVVEAVDAPHLRLMVLGQHVYVDHLTKFDGAQYRSFDDIALGDEVAVSGHFTADGRVVATHIDRSDSRTLLLRGVIVESSDHKSVSIGSLIVDFAGAIREGFPGGAPLAGDAVLLLASQPPVGGVLAATHVRCMGGCTPAQPAEAVGVRRGFITAWRSPCEFDVDGHATPVRYCWNSVPPKLNAFLELNFLSTDLTMARRDAQSTVWFSGALQSLDTLSGELVVDGRRVLITPATQVAMPRGWDYTHALSMADLAAAKLVTVAGGAVGAATTADLITIESAP